MRGLCLSHTVAWVANTVPGVPQVLTGRKREGKEGTQWGRREAVEVGFQHASLGVSHQLAPLPSPLGPSRCYQAGRKGGLLPSSTVEGSE